MTYRRSTDAAILARRRLVWELYVQHLSTYAIADALGISQKTAWRDVDAMMQEYQEMNTEEVKEAVDRELAELDASEVIAAAIEADEERPTMERMAAMDRRLKIKDHRAKIRGLYAAQRMEVSGKDGGAISITDARAELAEVISTLVAARGQGEAAGAPDPAGTV